MHDSTSDIQHFEEIELHYKKKKHDLFTFIKLILDKVPWLCSFCATFTHPYLWIIYCYNYCFSLTTVAFITVTIKNPN